MKKWMMVLCMLCLIAPAVFAQKVTSHSQIETIVIMRHGEKPTLDFGQLNCQGLNRSIALTKVLDKKYGKPDYIIAPYPYYNSFYYYVRALITIEPTAIQLGMPVITELPYFEYEKAAKDFLAEKYHQSVLFVCWEHLNIYRIARSIMSILGQDPDKIPSWPSSDYDSLYVFTIDWSASKPIVKFTHDHMKLDGQSKECPASAVLGATDANATQTLIFIPEVEPMPTLPGQLSCQGLNRSLALPKLLQKLYPVINFFVLPAPKEQTKTEWNNFVRLLMTVEPTMINRGGLFIPVGHDNIQQVVNYLDDSSFFNKTAAISWPIDEMVDLVKAVYKSHGGNPNEIPNITPTHDTIYQIKIDRSPRSTKPSFLVVQENLNNQPSVCPGKLVG